MINLLPPEEKQIILGIKRKKITVILWLFLLFFLLNLSLVLFALNFYMRENLRTKQFLFEEAKKNLGDFKIGKFQEEIKKTNIVLFQLKNFYQNKIYFSEILEVIFKSLPREMYLNNFSAAFFETDKESGFKFSLSGFSPNRETLLKFKKNLGEENIFKEIYFPASNWVKANDIDFYVTFKLNR